ncbi:MAG: hypothetical protein MI753_10940 [Hyphomicrobiales bacterium]|nr:hypothetical protein [Hyphomicrobiales bacterium]
MARADALDDDPLHALLIALKLLAEMLLAVVDGGINLSRAHGDKALLAKQVLLYRDFVRLVFRGSR